MNCANCGKTITDNSFSEDEYFFCNALCRYEWRRNGKPNPFTSVSRGEIYDNLRNIDLNFPIEPAGFEDRNFIIRPSYFSAPKLFIDDKKQIPIKKNVFSRRADYKAISNFGKDVLISIKHKPLDLIPSLYIDGQEFQIARSLTKWEYIWICLPALILFVGGAIGALIGMVATYSNSILIRKIKNKSIRYIYTGGTTLMAFVIFIKFVGFVNPYLFSLTASMDINSVLRQAAKQANIVCPQTVDDETRLDSVNVPQEKTISYYYTLLKMSKSEININAATQILRPRLIQHIKTQDDLLFMRQNNVTLVYKYFDKKGEKVLELPIIPADYK